MFSDFKTRGFGLEDSQIRLAGRLDRLILIPAHSDHGAGAVLGGVNRHVGCRPPDHPRRKKPRHGRPRRYARSLTSLFKRGLRRLHTCLDRLIAIPPRWAEWLIPQTDPW